MATQKAMNDNRRPLISVCIANFNGEYMLRDCITSIMAQQGNFDVEVIVHDDASRDGSLALLARIPGVRVIVSTENVGFCIANNRMVAQARGEYVLLVNNDAALLPNAIATLLDAAVEPGPARILSLAQYDWETGALVDRGCLLDSFHVPVPNIDSERRLVAYVIGACFWVAREDWLRLEGFPEWMESIGEDLFFCAQARLLGLQIEVPADSGYRHRQGVSFGGNRVGLNGLVTNYRRRYLSERNRAAVLIICTPGIAWLPWLLEHVAFLVFEGLILSLFKRDRKIWRDVYAKALGWLWRERSRLLIMRKDLQRKRRIGVFSYLKKGYTWKPRKFVMLIGYGLPRFK